MRVGGNIYDLILELILKDFTFSVLPNIFPIRRTIQGTALQSLEL